MTGPELVARVRVGSGRPLERLTAHPRLPLVAGLDSERPAVHVWDCTDGELHELGSVGAGSDAYGDAVGWSRIKRTPRAVWHPHRPLLLVAGEDGVTQWAPAGRSEPDLKGLPPTTRYRNLAFSPDGRTLWASPSSSGDEDGAWDRSDAIDLASGTLSPGPRWDTGVAEHPGGGLVVTLASDQGATLGLFARIDDGTGPASMRMQRRALILDADGYETPAFSPDGRHFAVRGHAYGNSLEVFEFPSLRSVLATSLGTPDQLRSWSRHNIAFGTRPGVLWTGTPTGTLVEVDVDVEPPCLTEHGVLAGSPVTALAATAAGGLVVATGAGDLALLALRSDAPPTCGTAADDAARAAVAAFLASTSEVTEDGDLYPHLALTDGSRAWEAEDLASVTTATATDPTWLQVQAAVNHAHGQDE
ncbi:hypothetical protein ACWGFX_40250 [Streptomyces xanthophaeus]